MLPSNLLNELSEQMKSQIPNLTNSVEQPREGKLRGRPLQVLTMLKSRPTEVYSTAHVLLHHAASPCMYSRMPLVVTRWMALI